MEPRRRAASRGRRARRVGARRSGRLAERRRRRVRPAVRAAERPPLAAAERARRGRERRRRAHAHGGAAARSRRRPDARRALALGARADGGAVMRPVLNLERSIAVVRLIAVPFAIFQVAATTGVPQGWQAAGWIITAALGIGAFAFGLVVRHPLSDRGAFAVSVSGQVFDTAVVSAFVIAYSFERGTLVPETLFFPLIAGCVRFALVGGLITAAASAPVMVVFEKLHSDHFNQDFRWDYVTLHVGLEALIALIVGRLVLRLAEESRDASSRAEEAVKLRDELARRADVLDAANRCARALSSSLDLDEAFGAFIRELRGLVPFDRVAIVLAEDGSARIIAAAGEQADGAMAPGAEFSPENSLIADIVAHGQTVYRRDMSQPAYIEERR